MQFNQAIGLFLLAVIVVSPVFAAKGRMATSEDFRLLKQDVVAGKIKIGSTRLKSVRSSYGDPGTITENDRQVTFDYGDLRLVFDKNQILKKWEYDTFKKPVYTDDVDDLRYDLENGELAGKNISYTRVRKDYGDPTESMETNEDGKMSVYYYGEVKLTFENVYLLKSWQGQKLSVMSSPDGVLQ